MIASRGKFLLGIGLMAGFVAILVAMFMPLFDEMNALDYMDALYNSISKGSAYFVPELRSEAAALQGTALSVALTLEGESQAQQTARLFERAGAGVIVEGKTLRVEGDLGEVLGRCIEDADEMFANRGDGLRERYLYDERRALYNWWTALKAMDKALKKQRQFPQAAAVVTAKKKAVECAYNYYGIEPLRITDRFGTVLFSLVFYVVYTVWYGFAIIFIFEGWGLKLSH
jgi:hypothetical protein